MGAHAVTHCSQKLNAAVAVVVETAYARFDSAVVVDVATLLGPANSHSAVETTDVGLTVDSSALEMPKERKQVGMRYFNASAQSCMKTLQ